MKSKKRVNKISMICVLSLIISTMFILNISANYSDSNNNPHYYGIGIENSGEPGPVLGGRALAECDGGPHIMVAHGWGSIKNANTGATVVSWGCCAQCSKCNLVIITQGEPGNGGALGYYTTWQPHEALTSNFTIIIQSPNNIQYTNNSTIPGIRFRYT